MKHISATRKKSCTIHVQSKRRYDLDYPFCRRYLTKILPAYIQRAIRDKKVLVRQSSPDLSPRKASAIDSSAEFLPFKGAGTDPLGYIVLLFSCTSRNSSCSNPNSWGEELTRAVSLPLNHRSVCKTTTSLIALLQDCSASANLADDQVQYVLRASRAYAHSTIATEMASFLWSLVVLSARILRELHILIASSTNSEITRLEAASDN